MSPGAKTPDDSGEGYVFQYASDDDDQPAIAVVKAVSWVKDVDVRDLEPLHGVIDADELDNLFGGRSDGGDFYRSAGRSASDGRSVTFRYEGCRVTVTGDEITVDPADT